MLNSVMQASWEQATASPPDCCYYRFTGVQQGFRTSVLNLSLISTWKEVKWQGSQLDTFVVPVCRNNWRKAPVMEFHSYKEPPSDHFSDRKL